MIESYALLALNVASLTVAIFGANLLILRSLERQVYLPLAICFVAIGILICQPTLASLGQQLQASFLVLSLPAILLISPCFWFYVVGLTSGTPWQFSRRSFLHFIPAGLGLIIAILATAVPSNITSALLTEGNDEILANSPFFMRNLVYGMLIATFILILGWVVQSGFYFYKIIIRLDRYRKRLKDIFASTESKEIKWLSWLLLTVGIVWVWVAVHIVIDNLFYSIQLEPIWINALTLLMLWTVALWGLRQKPGFEELYDSQNDIVASLVEEVNLTRKYQRSALGEQQSALIASKIEKSMREDKLYLDASLSLQKLAKHTNTVPNYISQTLNETLGMNFFDYVSKFRVEAAKQMLEETSSNVLDIAMSVGFNSKSSFYTAFKKETKQTPNQYRKESTVS